MSKGKKKRPPSSPSETDTDAHTAAVEPATDIPGTDTELTCSSCGSLLDPLKIDEPRCWLCGADNFVDRAEAELERVRKEAEKREFCCPNPHCARPLELVTRAEKYCLECGAHLEEATLDVWFRKYVEPEVAQDLERLFTDRARFVDAAWRMGLTKEESETRLDNYHASRLSAAARQTERKSRLEVETAPTEPAVGASDTGSGKNSAFLRQSAPADDARDLAIIFERLQDSYQRQRQLRVKYGFGIICLLSIGMVAILVGGRGGTNNTNEEVVPTPVPTATATPSSTPTPPPSMVLIEGEEFQMGRDLKDGGDLYESPAHAVTLNSFYLDVYEVKRAEYQKCVDAGKCEKPSEWNGGTYPAGTGQLPVTGVTWDDANRYAVWAGKRLPTEEEWEFAARGGKEERLYPWGNSWKPGQANVGGAGLAEVGSFQGASPFKLFDMIGNAQEWTSSELRKYPDKKAYMATGFPPEQLRVIRGGSYKDAAGRVTATYRDALRMSGEASYAQTGFRCARDATRP